jgi:heptosyltransferase II
MLHSAETRERALSQTSTPRKMTVVVIQTKRGIGDVIWHLPFIRSIAAVSPGGTVTFLAPPSTQARALLRAEPCVAETLYFENRGSELSRGLHLIRLTALLRRLRCDTAWILDRTTRAAFAALAAGIPNRIGLGLGPQRWFITNKGIDQRYFPEMPIEWLKALMEAMQVPCPTTEPNLRLPPEVVASLGERYSAYPRPWLVLGLGGSHPVKDWPSPHWLEFVGELRQRTEGTVFLIGGAEQGPRAGQLIARTTGAAAVNACDLPIDEAAALLRHADAFVGPDSGPMNLAAAVGTPAFGLFGATTVLSYSGFIHAIVPDDGGRSAPDGMQRISPRRVLERIEPCLSAPSVGITRRP